MQEGFGKYSIQCNIGVNIWSVVTGSPFLVVTTVVIVLKNICYGHTGAMVKGLLTLCYFIILQLSILY